MIQVAIAIHPLWQDQANPYKNYYHFLLIHGKHASAKHRQPSQETAVVIW